MATEPTISAIKIVCLTGVVAQLVFTWTRFSLLYYVTHQRTFQGSSAGFVYAFTWGLYTLWASLLTIYFPIQIYALVKEMKHDLLWYKHWFKRIYGMYISSFVFYQLGNVGWQTLIYLVMKFRREYIVSESVRVNIDVADAIIGVTTNVLFIIILFRPLMPNVCFGELTNQSLATVSYSRFNPDGRTDGHNEDGIHMGEGDTDTEDETCCNKIYALGFAIIFFILYLVGIGFVLWSLSKSVHCSFTGKRPWCF